MTFGLSNQDPSWNRVKSSQTLLNFVDSPDLLHKILYLQKFCNAQNHCVQGTLLKSLNSRCYLLQHGLSVLYNKCWIVHQYIHNTFNPYGVHLNINELIFSRVMFLFTVTFSNNLQLVWIYNTMGMYVILYIHVCMYMYIQYMYIHTCTLKLKGVCVLQTMESNCIQISSFHFQVDWIFIIPCTS